MTVQKSPRRSIFKTILRSMLAVLAIELALLVGTLVVSRVNTQLDQNAADILQKQTENRQNYLESIMLAAQDLSELERYIDATLEDLLAEGAVSLDTLDRSSEDALPLLEAIGPQLITALRSRSVTGVFVVLNTHDLDQREAGSSLPCVYLRDLDPTSAPSERNSDVTLVRSPTELVRSLHIATDTSWAPTLKYNGEIEQCILYPSFQAAYQDGGALDAEDYGHWTRSLYALAGDDHAALAYSIPLLLEDGTAYGVVGVEMLESHLRSLLPYGELQNNSSGVYMLATSSQAPGQKTAMTANVAVSASDGTADLTGQDLDLMPSARGGYQFTADGVRYHASVVPVSLYSRNAPFSNEHLLLIGAVPEHSLYAFSNYVLRMLSLAVILVVLVGLLASFLVSRRLARPVTRLSAEVADAAAAHDGIPTLSHTGILELDRFSSAFTQLSRDVLDSSTKFLRIMEMASVELGGYELRFDTGSVYVTDNFYSMLGMVKPSGGEPLTVPGFQALLRDFDRSCTHSTAPDGAELYQVPLPGGGSRYLRLETTLEPHAQVGLVEDVTASTRERLRVEYERDHDALTGLYNRQAFQRKCDVLFRDPEKMGCAALLMLDLDHLKQTNDTYGHDWGDRYIHQAGACLSQHASPKVLCARISGDEFNVLFWGCADQAEVRAAVAALLETVRQSTLQLPDGTFHTLSISGGLAWYPTDSSSLDSLRKYADFAMYQAKRFHKGELREFDRKLYDQDLFAAQMRQDFHRLVSEELVTYYFQPIFSAETGEAVAFEALMRVDLPTLRDPEAVLRLAREERCLHEIERITMFRSVRAFLALEATDTIPVGRRLFLNSIANQCLTEEEAQDFLALCGPLAQRIIIEITEEEDLDPEMLRQKRSLIPSGAFALDDYGSGYSNERSLLELSPNYIKLDRSIVQDIDGDPDKQQIVSSTVAYAHQRSMKLIAEGLETAAEVRTVLELGVDYLQGYYLARPAAIPTPIAPEALDLIDAFRLKG